MPLLLSTTTQVLIQGITGKEGMRGLAFMRAGGTNVVAGVTPGKGGQEVEGVPVYNSVAEALEHHPEISATSLYVPPQFVKSAALEAIASKIPLIHIFAEGVPTKDTALIIETAKATPAPTWIIGPSSIGLVEPGKAKLGTIGGDSTLSFLPVTAGQTGVAILSKSGGMSNEMAALLTQQNIPQTLVIGIGGDRFVGTTFADMLPLLAADEQTVAIVIIGEIGGRYEEDLAQTITELNLTKPVIAFISGLFAETLPAGVSFGHAGAIVDATIGTRAGKIAALRAAGAIVVDSPESIAQELIKQLKK
jgi:succinyl-CoA synthetase alpha subunit